MSPMALAPPFYKTFAVNTPVIVLMPQLLTKITSILDALPFHQTNCQLLEIWDEHIRHVGCDIWGHGL